MTYLFSLDTFLDLYPILTPPPPPPVYFYYKLELALFFRLLINDIPFPYSLAAWCDKLYLLFSSSIHFSSWSYYSYPEHSDPKLLLSWDSTELSMLMIFFFECSTWNLVFLSIIFEFIKILMSLKFLISLTTFKSLLIIDSA